MSVKANVTVPLGTGPWTALTVRSFVAHHAAPFGAGAAARPRRKRFAGVVIAAGTIGTGAAIE